MYRGNHRDAQHGRLGRTCTHSSELREPQRKLWRKKKVQTLESICASAVGYSLAWYALIPTRKVSAADCARVYKNEISYGDLIVKKAIEFTKKLNNDPKEATILLLSDMYTAFGEDRKDEITTTTLNIELMSLMTELLSRHK